MKYHHAQTGHFLRWATVPGAIGLFAAGYVAGRGLLFVPIVAILGGVGWIFSSLTVEVTANELIWFFGPGVWRKSIARDEILSATPVRNKWWWGWGIHLTPRGWLYNVAGSRGHRDRVAQWTDAPHWFRPSGAARKGHSIDEARSTGDVTAIVFGAQFSKRKTL
ncbi:MAG: hypothetical protein ACR2KT_15250 [Methylocella sp.]|nr:MAG: hypothetical protein DLM68_14725 [Hyphomicrobiales bacterium]